MSSLCDGGLGGGGLAVDGAAETAGFFKELGKGFGGVEAEGVVLLAEGAHEVGGVFEEFGEVCGAGGFPGFFGFGVFFEGGEFEIDHGDACGGGGDDEIVEFGVAVGEAVFVEF